MIEALFGILSHLFLTGVAFLGLNKKFPFVPPEVVEGIQNFVGFYEYVSWTFVVLAWFLLQGSGEYKERVTKKAESRQLWFYMRSLIYFGLTLISVAILRDYSLGALFIVTMLFYAQVNSMMSKK